MLFGTLDKVMKDKSLQKGHTSIFRKVFGRLVLIGILPIVTIAIAGGVILYFSYRQGTEDFERTLLAQKRVEVDRFIRETLESFELFVNYENVSPISQTDQEFLLEGYLEANEELVEVSFLETINENLRGRETARLIRSGAPFSERDRSNDIVFLTAQGGRQYIGPVYWKEKIPYVTLASPVRNKNGIVVNVLAGELRLSQLQQFFKGASFGREGAFYLLDEKGYVLAFSGAIAELQQDAVIIRDTALASQDAITDSTLSGKYSLVVALPATLTKWTFIAEWPVTDAFGPLINLLWQAALITGLLGAAIFFFSTRQAREIVTPIHSLQAAAARIGRGEFWGPIEVHTRDELEDLGESLRLMSGELARLQEIRSTEVRAQALAQAVEKEQELDEAKDALLTNASHQFRTPISVLNWNIDLLKTMQLPPDAAPLLEGIAEHAGNLSAIAGDLLNATAFGSGYVAQEGTAPVDLVRVIDEVLGRYRKAMERKKLRLSQQFPQSPAMIQGSYGALRILFEALVANAVTYTNEGGEIQMALQEQTDGTFACSIRDTGIGIPKQDQDKLFTAFYRASNAIVAKNVGTGLGLFVARNITAGHRGSIFVGSEEGKGTEFIVVLPKLNVQQSV